jgi:acetyl esterase
MISPSLSSLRVRLLRRLIRFLLRAPMRGWALRFSSSAAGASPQAGLDPALALVLRVGAWTGDTTLTCASVATARKNLQRGVLIAEDPVCALLETRDLTVAGATGQLAARLYIPAGIARNSAGLMFLHGGGWVTGDLATHDSLCRRLAVVAGVRVIAVAPRLAPEHVYPAAVNDALSAWRDIVRSAASLGIDARRLGIAGDSAGGNLAAVVSLETRSDVIKPKLCALLYPSLDATRSRPSVTENASGYMLTRADLDAYLALYLGPAATHDAPLDLTDPRLSPLFCENLRDSPATLVVACGFDPLRDEALEYAERLREAGAYVELQYCESLIHGFALMTGLSEAALAATEACARRVGQLLA